MSEFEVFLDDDDKDKKEGGGNPMLAYMIKSRTIIVSKGVDDDLARSVISQLFVLEQEEADKPITVIVNSPGGSADCGFAILDAMRFVRCPIRTITMGLSASAGVMIHLGGDAGKRFVSANARFLLHQPSMRSMGQASDLEIVASEIERIKKVYNRIVSEATTKSLEEVERAVDRDFWLSAEESVEWGLADRIVTKRSEIE
ncbi:MAG: ATP-dependent Clp protease proteolytic subunit [Planctomycetota bacterium]